ncbi:MAG: helix-turn-helix domain-containing protein [Chitinophagales bacterium]
MNFLFGDKLAYLMRGFQISNSKLAKAINVDPSLISKWINNRRKPSPDSAYINQIAEYFARMNWIDMRHKNLIVEMGLDTKTFFENRDPLARIETLTDWLREQFDLSPASNVSTLTSFTSSASSLTSLLNSLHNFSAQADSIPDVLLPIPSVKLESGDISSYELFKGRSGKRQAVYRFLNLVLKSSKPVELLLSSEENIRWLIEDQDFLFNWAALLKAVLDRGHRIKIVHKVNRDPSNITAVMNQWIPLHLTGRVESYYYPKYEETSLQKTMFVAPELAAVLSATSEKKSDNDLTFFIEDPRVVDMAQENYLVFLSECRPLVNVYARGKMMKLHCEIIDLEKKPGSYYILKEIPSSVTIPFETYSGILGRTEFDGNTKQELLDLHRRRIAQFNDNLRYYRHREYYPIEAIDELINEDGCIYPGIELLQEQPILIQPTQLLEHLQNILGLLETCANYEVIFFNRRTVPVPSKMYLAFKEDSSVLMSSCNETGENPIAIVTSEGNIIQAFEDYFESINQQVPPGHRNKEWVCGQLKKRIARLERITKV